MVEKGKTIKLHYKGTLSNGEIFDTSEGKEPLEFIVGENQVIPGFENGVIGLTEGDKKTIVIESKDAYGDHNPEMIQVIESKLLPEKAVVGTMLQGHNQTGQPIMCKIIEINSDDNNAKVDFNHPLAGEKLTFDIELVEIL